MEREVTHRFFQIAQSLYVEEAEANPCLLQPYCPPATATHTQHNMHTCHWKHQSRESGGSSFSWAYLYA